MATPCGVPCRVRPQVQRGVRGQQDRLEQAVDADPLLGGDVDEHRVAAVLLGDQAVLGELLRTLAGLAPSLSTLLTATTIGTSAAWAWLSASIVCGITPSSAATTRTAMSVDLRTTGTHGGERLVTRGVDEGDRAVDALVLGACTW